MRYLKTYKNFENKYIKKSQKLFESANDFLDSLSDSWVRDYHADIHGKGPGGDFDEMIYYLDPWDYVDDDRFVSDWIDGEINHYYEDWDYRFDDDYDKDKWIIPFLESKTDDDKELCEAIYKKYVEEYIGADIEDEDDLETYEEEIKDAKEQIEREGYDWMLPDISVSTLKEILDEECDRTEFIREYLERYQNTSAKDIISEFHSKSELEGDGEVWRKDYYNIKWYVDEKKMEEDMPEWDWEDIVDHLDIENNDKFQIAIFEKWPEKAKKMWEEGVVGDDLKEKGEFQESYFDIIHDDYYDIVEMVDEEIIGPEFGDTVKFQKAYFDAVKEYDDSEEIETERLEELDDLGITINKELIKTYPELEPYIDSKELGLL